MKKYLLAAAALTALPAANASATTIIIYNWSIGANLIGGVTVTTPAISHGAIYINQFHYTGHDTNGNVFDQLTNCVDLEHYVATGTYTLGSISSRIPDLTKLRQMLTFIGTTTGIVAGDSGQQKNIDAAAMQLGIWEILYEGGNSNYNVTSGNFRSSFAGYVSQADFSAAQTLANSWLGNTTSGLWTAPAGKTLGYLTNPNLQSQVYLRDLEQGEKGLGGGPGAVPEPASWALMISGFGLVGWTSRRRRAGHMVRALA
ncbi:hypothetical protein SPAN111604_08440 [Sphingomonas antarctica]|uniref:PEPxxWA-CTERM sorting domain-containing protein n=1 Tax=Sphingomonas antarctica TaxID=2040274 RepID=UPI0039EB6C5E